MSQECNSDAINIKLKSKIINDDEEITLKVLGPTKNICDEFGPNIIEIDLNGEYGFQYRKAAYKFVNEIRTRGKESGTLEQQFTGKLAEYVVKDLILNSTDPENLGHDLKLESNIKVDVKCRGGKYPFEKIYINENKKSDREAKHNFYARQIFDYTINYDADIYIMCHLKKPSPSKSTPLNSETAIIGTKRQRSWKLYICGWIPKSSVVEALFLPRGAVTESGNSWFAYKGDEVEFYHKHLEPLWIESNKLEPLSSLSKENINKLITSIKSKNKNHLHTTTADYARICCDLAALGVISQAPADSLSNWEPILHKNQYYHVSNFLSSQGINVDFSILKKYLGEETTFNQ